MKVKLRMNRMTRRVLRIELLRGTAPIAALGVAGATVALLFNEAERWAGRWELLAQYLRVVMFILIPIAAAAGAWQAGRERRRRIGELLATTSRPRAHPVLVAWTAVTAGTFAGFVLAWLSGAVLVAPVATYEGRGWWWTLGVALCALATASAVGAAAGRLVPGRLAAPIAGMAVLLGISIVDSVDGSPWALSPTLREAGAGTEYLDGGTQILQMLWLAAAAVTVLTVAVARTRWLAAVPAVAAVAAAVPLANASEDDYWRDDPAARELVCTDDDGAEVCMSRVNAFLLDDATGPVREQLARWEAVDGGFIRAVDQRSLTDDDPAPGRTALIDMALLVSWNGALAEQTEHGESVKTAFAAAADDMVYRNCDPFGGEDDIDAGDEPLVWAAEVAHYWTLGEMNPVGTVVAEGERAEFQVLLGKPEAEQKDWLGRYLRASQTCDSDVFADLMAELQ